MYRYFVQIGEGPEREVSEEEFISWERKAGFRPKSGTGVATGGFSTTAGGGIRGKMEPS